MVPVPDSYSSEIVESIIDPLRDSDNYGIDLYVQLLNIIST